MIVVSLPSFDSIEAALDWLAGERYSVVRVVLTRGADGLVRGSALVRPAS